MIEAQVEYLLRALEFMRTAGVATVEPRPEAQQVYVAEVDGRMGPTVWSAGGCASWYIDQTGRISALWPGFTWAYRRRTRRFDPELHLTTPQPAAPRPVPSPARSTS
jgi:hypothetical protein